MSNNIENNNSHINSKTAILLNEYIKALENNDTDSLDYIKDDIIDYLDIKCRIVGTYDELIDLNELDDKVFDAFVQQLYHEDVTPEMLLRDIVSNNIDDYVHDYLMNFDVETDDD
jgi:hypothetical protein